jgi:hypothetical protein
MRNTKVTRCVLEKEKTVNCRLICVHARGHWPPKTRRTHGVQQGKNAGWKAGSKGEFRVEKKGAKMEKNHI